jgi:lipopolysaccharide transport system permease protein
MGASSEPPISSTPAAPLAPSLSGLGPLVLARRLRRHRYLLRQLVRKNVATLYQGSIAGVAWIILRPLLTLAIFGFCFGVVYRSRFFHREGSGKLEFAMALFLGLTLFSVLSEMVSSAPSLIASNGNLVKRVVFPLDVLVVAQLGSTLVQMAMSAAVFMTVRLFMEPPLGAAAISVPLIVLPFLLLTLGMAWFLASLGVFVRDIQQVVPLIVTALMFISPLFYPASAVPDALRSTLYLNPVTFPVESARNALFLNEWPDLWGWSIYTAIAVVVMWLGWVWFEKTKKGFADVL